MSDDAKITILHLSDLQFGRHHRFGRFGLTDPDVQADKLVARLTRDLEDLRKTHNLHPDLVIVTGDLAEWARPKELDDLAAFLTLAHSRFSIVPGNHDINRGVCECYFIDCQQEEGRPPEKSYWPKWKYYSAFFERFYKGERSIAGNGWVTPAYRRTATPGSPRTWWMRPPALCGHCCPTFTRPAF